MSVSGGSSPWFRALADRRALAVNIMTVVGVFAAVLFAELSVHAEDWSGLAAGVLPAAFLAAGLVGARGRPDHPGVLLLTAVGALHLCAFALITWVASRPTPGGWVLWMLTVAGDAAYIGGFLALAVVVACYPLGWPRTRVQRWFSAAAVGVAVMVLFQETMLRSSLTLLAGFGVTTLPAPAPAPLPVAALSFSSFAAVPALIVAAVVVLVISARRFEESERRALSWGRLAGFMLALMLALTPVADNLTTDAVWTAIFVPVVAVVPFMLLAGLVRYRLLRVDLYVVRTIARGVVLAVALTLCAVASAQFDERGFALAGAVLTVAAALTGTSAVRWLERVADRVVTNGRVGRSQLADHLAAALSSARRDTVLDQTCALIKDALDASWVRLVTTNQSCAGSRGDPLEAPAAIGVALAAAGESVGILECGPRRGGWRSADVTVLRGFAVQIALAVRDVELTHQLAERVDELAASRNRIVQAEDTARRRIERNLHDGVQQQLVALLARLAIARAAVPDGAPVAAALTAANALARQALHDLRDLVAGIHPALLGDQGLLAAVQARAAHLPLDVDIDADPRIADARFAPEIEGAAYFVVLEALANVMKHSGSPHARLVLAPLPESGLRVAVVDEGHGSSDLTGSGLTGLRDRVEALGGRLILQTALGVGTTVIAEFLAPQPVVTHV